MPIYDGSEFARRGVVLVTINYRLGLLGFFAHPALLAEPHEEGTGNFGVMDAIAALRWVRTNIAAFGGDPRNVTVFGESAGGQMVNALMTSPQASGLFQRAISQSAFNRVQWRTMRGTEGDTAERIGIEFARSQGIQGSDAQAAQALRALPAQRVGGIRIGGGTSGTLPLALPMVDGRVLTEQVLDAFTAGRAAKVPFITGSNGWEASLVPSVAKRPENTLAALGAVRGRVEKAYAGASLADMALDVKTDVSSTEPVRQFARLHAANGQKAFAYHFSYLPKSQRDSLHGTPHGGEIAYVFGNLGDREVRFYDVVHPPATPQDRAISEAAITYWTNFARTGEPGSVAGVAWPTIGADDAFLEFGPETFSLRPHFRQRRLDALERAPQRVRLPADD
jgi:para-nitrobenzyl esterase